ncbi:hypothetical protein NW768_004055 [Fusarium equiseti]|uniref:Uncharacterized protein n=1 Tax=Fusarium equiseti TaxID=61235 RepID=A0ABQ8RJL6_FUSEQ|nr:hypothetical protein NW768_004055 [Fusarium equiseti]
MPKGATSYNRERFRDQPYGFRSIQSNLQNQQPCRNNGGSSASNSEVQTSIVQPVDQDAPEAPNNDTGEHTDDTAHLNCQPIPPLAADFPIPDPGSLNLPAEPRVIHLNGTDESIVGLIRALPPGPKYLEVTVEKDSDTPADIPVDAGPSEPPRGPQYSRSRYDSYRPRELKMVNSMLLQSISRTNSRAPPSMSIYNNSRGGGVQDNVFTKVPSASKTISFRVDSEETLLQAYRHVKSMNPSAPVGGIMFSVPPKTEKHEFLFTEVNNIRWNSLTGRQNPQLPPGVKIFRKTEGSLSMPEARELARDED